MKQLLVVVYGLADDGSIDRLFLCYVWVVVADDESHVLVRGGG